jgi:hypothetical protein
MLLFCPFCFVFCRHFFSSPHYPPTPTPTPTPHPSTHSGKDAGDISIMAGSSNTSVGGDVYVQVREKTEIDYFILFYCLFLY